MSSLHDAAQSVSGLLVASSHSVTALVYSPPYDVRGRQQQFIETAQQRKDRVEFSKKKEWARHVAEWIRAIGARQNMTFGCSGRLAASSPMPENGDITRLTASASSLSLSSSEEEEEPYIIYSSSPSSSMSSLSSDLSISSVSTSHLSNIIHPLSSSIPHPPKRIHCHRRSSASLMIPHRRSSLSSIHEVPEED
ncbi:uncharacterized protein F5891DRAFT_603910 [Suillus fuscotomentosus]|uniref:Uncharacterized protein n=1 Tax=Suillus fuscotomentosus TaxID=1912939 RepID=A0AAD4DY25_9AGAM|nr:uncharacterized protein F5891DRAFT_603910 [Suillus fuscotomentosus]KAG1896211.1 hypothetical protein F5891DRAFT_603910 [Suillus fuscotomentosus]